MDCPLSCVLPTYQRPDLVLVTLEKIMSCVPAPAEIIVHIDGGCSSLQNTLAEKFPTVKVLSSNSLLGPGGSRNRLIHAASYELVANFDDDSYPAHPDYFSRAIQSASRLPNAAIISATNDKSADVGGEFFQVAAFEGCGCLFRKSWFLKTSGFVPLPIAYNMEEVDLGLRILSLNGKVIQDGKLRVIHDRARHNTHDPHLIALVAANSLLLPYLRFPKWLWPLGLAQLLSTIMFLMRTGRANGILQGLRLAPNYLLAHKKHREVIGSSTIFRWLILRRWSRSIADQA